MAKVCFVGDGLCTFLLFACVFTTILSHEDYFFYRTDDLPHSTDDFHKELQHHQLDKRETQPETTNDASSTTSTTSTTKDALPPIAIPTKPTTIEKKPIYATQNLTQKMLNSNNNNNNNNSSTQMQKATIPMTMTSTNMPQNNNIPKNKQTDDEDDISINKFSESVFNKTLQDHNITQTRTDSHTYYNSSIKTDEKTGDHYWVDMNTADDVKVSDLLSKSHRRAATVRLSFDFPFYGHYIRNVTIATGGFLYTGDYVHSWLAATQYIAPLMANFDTSLSTDSYIKYADNKTAFTVLWENVSLQDKPFDGRFTFQATLHKNGDIVFVYRNVPLIIEDIQDQHHPVKVGLSDAYIIDRTIFFVRRKTIYEYHRVNFRKEDIKNGTVILLRALQTCPGIKDCYSCLTSQLPSFECGWCPALNKCSNGLDRNRQEWLAKSCDKKQLKNESECSLEFSSDSYDDKDLTYSHPDNNNFDQMGHDHPMRVSSHILHDSNIAHTQQPVKMGMPGIVAILFLVALISGVAAWLMYAYRNPHTTSGQMLIRYRPSQWSWRRGEARYTAATIHM